MQTGLGAYAGFIAGCTPLWGRFPAKFQVGPLQISSDRSTGPREDGAPTACTHSLSPSFSRAKLVFLKESGAMGRESVLIPVSSGETLVGELCRQSPAQDGIGVLVIHPYAYLGGARAWSGATASRAMRLFVQKSLQSGKGGRRGLELGTLGNLDCCHGSCLEVPPDKIPDGGTAMPVNPLHPETFPTRQGA